MSDNHDECLITASVVNILRSFSALLPSQMVCRIRSDASHRESWTDRLATPISFMMIERIDCNKERIQTRRDCIFDCVRAFFCRDWHATGWGFSWPKPSPLSWLTDCLQFCPLIFAFCCYFIVWPFSHSGSACDVCRARKCHIQTLICSTWTAENSNETFLLNAISFVSWVPHCAHPFQNTHTNTIAQDKHNREHRASVWRVLCVDKNLDWNETR